MKKRTVKRRIFISNTLMIVVTLILFFVINLGVVKIYWESIEHEWEASLQTIAGAKSVEHMIEQWTVHQHSFFLLLLADVIFCIGVWIFVSSFHGKSRTAYHEAAERSGSGSGADSKRRID